MKPIVVAPSLVLDDEMYERAKNALRQRAPEQVADFTWRRFIARESWRLIPDVEHPDEPFFKAEMIVKLGPPFRQTVKLNLWRSPDLRRDGAPIPHNHPWEFFDSHVLCGGIVEDRYQLNNGRVDVSTGWPHEANNTYRIPSSDFHEVIKVLEPGKTLTLMDCGPGVKNNWGYLDPTTGLYTPAKQSPIDARFKPLFLERNPHLR